MSEEEYTETVAAIGYIQHNIMCDLDKLNELVEKLIEGGYDGIKK